MTPVNTPSQTQKARKYWQDSLKKYRQRVLNQGRLQYRVALPSPLESSPTEKKKPLHYTYACYWLEVIHHDLCAYCGGPADNVDHIVPIKDIGMEANRWDNLTACCAKCNRSKWTKSLLFYLMEVNH